MRQAVLASVLALLSFPFLGCGDASEPAGGGRRGAGVPSDPAQHDATDPGDQDNGTPDPSATSKPSAPSDPGKPATTFSIAVDNVTPQVNLGDAVELVMTLTPMSGATGQATLTVSGLPAGVTATFMPATVTIGAAPVTAKVSLKADFTAAPTANGTPVVVNAVSSAGTATANANFKVNNAVTLTIPVNIDALNMAGKQTAAYGSAFTGAAAAPTFRAGAAVTVYNADSAPHIIHGQSGFAHGDTGNPIAATSFEMQSGQKRVRTLAAGTTPNGYLHTQGTIDPSGTNAPFAFKVQ